MCSRLVGCAAFENAQDVRKKVSLAKKQETLLVHISKNLSKLS